MLPNPETTGFPEDPEDPDDSHEGPCAAPAAAQSHTTPRDELVRSRSVLVVHAMVVRGICTDEDHRAAWRDWTRFPDMATSPPDILQGVIHALGAPTASVVKGPDGRWRLFIKGHMFYGPQTPDSMGPEKKAQSLGVPQQEPPERTLF